MRLLAPLLMSVALAAASPARAALFTLTFDDGAGGLDATLSATQVFGSTYQVTDVSGTLDGAAISGPISFFGSDNLIFTTGTVVDSNGLAFQSGTTSFDFYYSGSAYTLFNGMGFSFPTSVALTPGAAAVPEPDTWALLGIGVAGWLAMRRRPVSVASRAARAIPSSRPAPHPSSASMA